MSIYRCPHCKHLGEHTAPAGAGHCARCGGETKLYDAVHFINQILARYTAALRELDVLREASADGVPPRKIAITH
ncbi:hypothetical protein [Conchiformibius kuhniae]|uniref:Uncharacterized protein n=1 Tax=Conchiformibius kuhniae TaxID=211502 RepID=A0A8T9MVX2_9NEIS|nr:hypothetical protein [Conchiformibius kuhniae]UOP04616.1 hypothetical protein LVJ77_10345 [Conchiformibius kuhniae]